MSPVYKERINQAFALYTELGTFLDRPVYKSKLGGLPSNTVGQQLWCVIGARESYVKGIQKGQWDGFSCSLSFDSTADKDMVLNALNRSAENAQQIFCQLRDLSEPQERLAMELLEHEIQHHGQLIRYLYGLKIGIPKGWKDRYHLE